jgi:hypothetical protein
VSGDDPGERERVYAKIAPLIMSFREDHAGALFHVEELRVFVREQLPEIAPDSPGRILRALRLEGRLDYVIINRRESLYQFCAIRPTRAARRAPLPPPSLDPPVAGACRHLIWADGVWRRCGAPAPTGRCPRHE